MIDRVRIVPPQTRDEELRALKLARLDGSWWGQSLYGGAPVRPVRTTAAEPSSAVLMVRSSRGVLRDEAVWGAVVQWINRQRLERLGITADRSLGANLPPPDVAAWQQPPRGLTLRMIVRTDDPLEPRLAEAIAAMLDEHGIRLIIGVRCNSLSPPTNTTADRDLRFGIVRPPLPDAPALVGAALAVVDQADRARRIAQSFEDAGHHRPRGSVARCDGARSRARGPPSPRRSPRSALRCARPLDARRGFFGQTGRTPTVTSLRMHEKPTNHGPA